jgi:hypothetical protein
MNALAVAAQRRAAASALLPRGAQLLRRPVARASLPPVAFAGTQASGEAPRARPRALPRRGARAR